MSTGLEKKNHSSGDLRAFQQRKVTILQIYQKETAPDAQYVRLSVNSCYLVEYRLEQEFNLSMNFLTAGGKNIEFFGATTITL